MPARGAVRTSPLTDASKIGKSLRYPEGWFILPAVVGSALGGSANGDLETEEHNSQAWSIAGAQFTDSS